MQHYLIPLKAMYWSFTDCLEYLNEIGELSLRQYEAAVMALEEGRLFSTVYASMVDGRLFLGVQWFDIFRWICENNMIWNENYGMFHREISMGWRDEYPAVYVSRNSDDELPF